MNLVKILLDWLAVDDYIAEQTWKPFLVALGHLL